MPRPKPTPPRGPNPWEKQDRARAIRRAVIVISAVAAAVAGVVITMVVAIGPATPPPAPDSNERTSSARAPAERAGASVTGNTASAEVPTQAVPMPGRRPPQAPLSEPPVAPGSHASMIEVIGPSQSPKPVVYASNEIVFGRYDAMKRGDGGADFKSKLIMSSLPASWLYSNEPKGGPTEALLGAVHRLGEWSPHSDYDSILELSDPSAVLPKAELQVELRGVPASVDSVFIRVRHVCDDADRTGLERLVSEPNESSWVEVRLRDGAFGATGPGDRESEASAKKEASTWKVDVAPRWDNDALSRLRVPTDAELQIEVRFPDGSVKLCRSVVTIAPTSTMDWRFPLNAGVATLLDLGHPFVQALRGRIDSSPLVQSKRVALGGHPQAWKDVFLWFRELASANVRYDNKTFSPSGGQRVRAIHEVLGGGEPQGNCIDLSVLMASALAATEHEVYLVIIPDHAFIAFWDKSEAWDHEGKVHTGRLRGLECTLLQVGEERLQPNDAVRRMSGAERSFYENDLSLPRDKELFRQFVSAVIEGTARLSKMNSALERELESYERQIHDLDNRAKDEYERLNAAIASSDLSEAERKERLDRGASAIKAGRLQALQRLIADTRISVRKRVDAILHVKTLYEQFRPPATDAADLRRMGFALPPPSSPSPK